MFCLKNTVLVEPKILVSSVMSNATILPGKKCESLARRLTLVWVVGKEIFKQSEVRAKFLGVSVWSDR